jgi:hypothetical protein
VRVFAFSIGTCVYPFTDLSLPHVLVNLMRAEAPSLLTAVLPNPSI